MVTEETLKTHEMELESRIRNLVWTVSGDYTLKLNPDVERYAKGGKFTGFRQSTGNS